MNITYVKVKLQLHLATIAINRSSVGAKALRRLTTGLQTIVWLIWYCIHDCIHNKYNGVVMYAEEKRTSEIDSSASIHPTVCQQSEYLFRLLELIEIRIA